MLNHAVQIAQYTLIRESHDVVAECSEVVVPFGIILAPRLVDFAVDLYYQLRSDTDKIDDIRADRMLPSEEQSTNLTTTNCGPDLLLRVRLPVATLARRR